MDLTFLYQVIFKYSSTLPSQTSSQTHPWQHSVGCWEFWLKELKLCLRMLPTHTLQAFRSQSYLWSSVSFPVLCAKIPMRCDLYTGVDAEFWYSHLNCFGVHRQATTAKLVATQVHRTADTTKGVKRCTYIFKQQQKVSEISWIKDTETELKIALIALSQLSKNPLESDSLLWMLHQARCSAVSRTKNPNKQ